VLAGLGGALLDLNGEDFFAVGREELNAIDLPQVDLDREIRSPAGFSVG